MRGLSEYLLSTDAVEKCGFLISAAVFRLSCAGGCYSNPRCIDFDANWTDPIVSDFRHTMRAGGLGPQGSECKCFEVLHNGGEMKLVARAGKSPEPQPVEAVVCLQVREAHFNTLPFVSRLGKRLCLHLPSCDIAGVLMDIARDLARIGRGAALRSYWAHVAVPLRGAVQQRASVVHGAAGLKQFPIWADVGPALPVPVAVRTGEEAVLPNTHLPYRDVRDNFLPLDQPAEELARPVGRVRGEPPWFQIKR